MREDTSYNLILLGGTGARCGEIFVHMCANGYFEGDVVNILYIDSDDQNGNAESFKRVLKNYKCCREQYMIEESPIPGFFRPIIRFIEEDPAREVVRFRDLANSDGGMQITEGAKALMAAMYSEEEMNMKISEGFFAHPNVGAAVFAANMDKIMEKFLKIVELERKNMKKARIFILGSVFGGTGAASLPTIGEYLKRKLFGDSDNRLVREQLKIGSCIVLPYFSFYEDKLQEKVVAGEDILIEPDKFATKTYSALKYYQDIDGVRGNKIFDSIYIIGHDGYDVRGTYHNAGKQQKNLPHVVELYGAMATTSFFEERMDKIGSYFAVVPSDKITWDCIDKNREGYFSFFVMMRFAIVIKSLILEELFDYTKSNKLRSKVRLIPWYYDFLDGKSSSSNMNMQKLYDMFKAISEYCDDYIRWFAELNIANLDKLKHLEQINYLNNDGDTVGYLSLFQKELLIRQYQNNRIANNEEEKDKEILENLYRENLEYIRNNLEHLEEIHAYTDLESERVSMDNIWRRLCDAGFNLFVRNDNVFKNIVRTNDKSMESGIRNLVNAVFCSCLY